MKKLIQRTKGFEKSFAKLNVKTQKLFIKKFNIFIEDEYASSLKTHQLKGERKNEYSFSITGDIRAIYEKSSNGEKETLIFKFIDIGGHNEVY
jgi:mRNA-degrading endonuclease YafQ of YafQ-DinJ toxin-antitoxin module